MKVGLAALKEKKGGTEKVKPSVLEGIVRFRNEKGESYAGKFLQRLLALTFIKAGFDVEAEYSVEGPDILVGPFQIEVKTTTSEPFTIEKKDARDIRQAVKKGKTPVLALLECSSFRGWTIVYAEGLTEGSFSRKDLALRRIPDLERKINDHFDDVVEAWIPKLERDPDRAFEEMDVRRRMGQWHP